MIAFSYLTLMLLVAETTLLNGIRIVELPAAGDSVEIVAGYQTAAGHVPGIQAARSLALNAYAAGGEFEFLSEVERTGFRLQVPRWSLPMVLKDVAAYLAEAQEAYERTSIVGDAFRSKVESEIRNALLGPEYQAADFSTERAFVTISGAVPDELRGYLEAIPKRTAIAAGPSESRLRAERTFRYQSQEEVGAVIFASPVPGVFYQDFYAVLLLDGLIRRVLTADARTSLPLTLQGYYYRVELPVPAGQAPEPVEQLMLQEIQRLQFTRSEPEVLYAVRQEAREYFQSRSVAEWFSSLGIPDRHEEGLRWIDSLSADELRGAARDILVSNRVVATWGAQPRQMTIEVRDLSDSLPDSPLESAVLTEQTGGIEPASFAPHTDPAYIDAFVEALPSGISIVESSIHGVFVSGIGLTTFENEPGVSAMRQFGAYNAGRILVLAPTRSIGRTKQIWSEFGGNALDTNLTLHSDDLITTDLPALLVLKTILDRRLIEAGWWNNVTIEIAPGRDMPFEIRTDPDKQRRVIQWIQEMAVEAIPIEELNWAHEAAFHNFAKARPHLQSIAWERDSLGLVQDPRNVSADQIRQVAERYYSR